MMIRVLVVVLIMTDNCLTDFLYDDYLSALDTGKSDDMPPRYNDVVTSSYERQLYLSKVTHPNSERQTMPASDEQHNATLLHGEATSWMYNTHEILGDSQKTDFLSFLSYSYDDALEYFPGDDQEMLGHNDSIKAMLAELMHQSSCTHTGQNGSVMCCTFSIDDSSSVSTICTNESEAEVEQQVHNVVKHDLCPEIAWKSLVKWVCIPVLCAFGLCGNTVSFLVMCSSSYRRKSYAHYLRALAVFDNLTLIINLVFTVNDFMISSNEAEGINSTYTGIMLFHTTASCKISEFMRHVVYLMSSWLVVCFTVDRFIAVCFPLLRMRYCTERCAITTIVIVLVVVMSSQSYHLVFIERLDRNSMPCHANPAVRLTYFGLNYFWFSFLLRFTLPFIAITMCNGCIIYHIARMRKGRWAKETRRKQKASLAIYTLYAVCACFVITVLPNAIVSIIQFGSYFSNERTMDTKLFCTLRTVYTPLHILRLVNYSANFVLYGIAGRQFRKELYKLLLCCTGRNSPDKRSVLSPEPIALKADLLLTSRKNGNTVIKVKQAEL